MELRPAPDGSSQTTVPIGSGGMVNVNVATTAESGFSGVIDFGSIRTSLNLTINSNTGQVGLNQDSSATSYPSIAAYSYVYEGKNIVTTMIIEQPEGSPNALKEPMKPLPSVKPR